MLCRVLSLVVVVVLLLVGWAGIHGVRVVGLVAVLAVREETALNYRELHGRLQLPCVLTLTLALACCPVA